jgi:hypothetical protein
MDTVFTNALVSGLLGDSALALIATSLDPLLPPSILNPTLIFPTNVFPLAYSNRLLPPSRSRLSTRSLLQPLPLR